jgi:hypothetical protein
MNKMYLVLGDWSDDGHGKHDKILLESNISVEDIQNAYKSSCKMTGVSFNNDEDYTETNRDWKESEKYVIATEYDDGILSLFVFNILAGHGLTRKMLEDWDTENFHDHEIPDDGFGLTQETYVQLWIWFVKLSLPKNTVLKVVEVNDDIPVINGYWNDNLNVSFGYGLYY